MNGPKTRDSCIKALLAVCVILTCLALAGSALAGMATNEAITVEPVLVQVTGNDQNLTDINLQPELNGKSLNNIVVQPTGSDIDLNFIAPQPARYGGYVKYASGDPVDWEEIAGYIDMDNDGVIDPEEIPEYDHNKLLKNDSGNYTLGQYGLPLSDHLNVKQLVVNCPEDTVCTNKNVLFRVKIGSSYYNATPSPTPVKWISNQYRQVDLTIPNIVGIKGYAYLEKVYPTDPSVNHQGTQVKVSQGGNNFYGVTNPSGYYEVTGPLPGSCTVEYSNDNGSWKKVNTTANIGVSGLTQMPEVTLYMGDVNQDGAINFSDLLWLSGRVGAAPGNPLWNQLGDVNKDGRINILDMLRVEQNVNK
ncbi:MAG: dockerin type I domain-containing protein [Desulfotomaculaceae bacterium]|nr:dockerin type I domain-containing protein [Desulfotomaculaceae bacterium]